MKNVFFTALTLAIVCALPALAVDNYKLSYKKDNRWVAQEDATGLRNLLKDAKKNKAEHFYVQLPTDNREITIERLIVLRDILEKQLKTAVTIEETDNTSDTNQMIVTFK
tara:strand:+ start:170590 stop:170919 length:330 start_codon:yes stop_codon:yes gene_type:complete